MAFGKSTRLATLMVAAAALVVAAVLAANATTDDSNGKSKPSVSVERTDLDAAVRLVTSRASRENWPIAAVSHTSAAQGIKVEVMTTKPLPELESSIRALVGVPVAFEYGASPGIKRPAQADPTQTQP